MCITFPIIRQANSIIVLLFIQNISQFLTSLPPRRLSPKLWPILNTVSGYKQMFFFLRMYSSKSTNIHRANVLRILAFPPFTFGQKFCFSFALGQSCTLFIQFTLAKRPMQPRFQDNIPSINFVSKSIFHRIDGILIEFPKFGQRRLVMKNQQEALSQSERAKYFE